MYFFFYYLSVFGKFGYGVGYVLGIEIGNVEYCFGRCGEDV